MSLFFLKIHFAGEKLSCGMWIVLWLNKDWGSLYIHMYIRYRYRLEEGPHNYRCPQRSLEV